MTGLVVTAFKMGIKGVRSLCYEQDLLTNHHDLVPLIPALGGAIVGLLMRQGEFSPGVKGIIGQVEGDKGTDKPMAPLKKAFAAIATLGTGCSLGPEGPCVELGLQVAKACSNLNSFQTVDRNDMQILLSSGAAAGVAAGFNAPIVGVFFALEILQKTFHKMTHDKNIQEVVPSITSDAAAVAPILLASVVSAWTAQQFLGNHLALTQVHLAASSRLSEMPLYLLLGCLSGAVAFLLTQV